MSLIGNEILPNLHIERINLYDQSVETMVYCLDSVENPVWSDHVLSMENFRIMVVSTTSNALANLIRFGYIKMDPKEITKEDPNASIDILPISRVELKIMGDTKYYRTTVKQKYSPETGLLKVYAAIVVDPVPLAGTRFVFNSYIQGPISAESVLSAGDTTTEASVWTLPNNEQWIGPVHSHPQNGFMQGSEHSSVAHQAVTRNLISNLKLKDKRSMSFSANSSSGKKTDVTEISDLFSSFDEGGKGNSIFFLNAKEIIYKNTKFGTLLSNTSPDLFRQIISDLRFRLIAIDRHKVKTVFSNNKLKETKILQTKRVMSAYQDVSSEVVVTRGEGLIKKTLFPFDNEIFSYEFIDPEMTTKLKGEYKYSITFNFSDPTIILAKEMMLEISNAITSVGRYLGRIKRQLKSKDTAIAPPMEWISGEKARFSENPETAPWLMAPMVFSKYKKMFFKVSEEESRKIESDLISSIEPNTFTIKAINTFKSELNNLYRYIDKIFNLQTGVDSNFNIRSQPKTETITNLISKKFSFPDVLTPSDNQKFYTFLQPVTNAVFTKTLSLRDFRERIQIENDKFFDNVSQNTSPEDTIQDTNTSMASYFTPYAIKDDSGNVIDLNKIEDIDKIKFNRFFDNVKQVRIRSPKKNVKRSFVVNTMNIVLKADTHVESAEYLGIDSTFNSYTDIDSSTKTIRANKETLDKVKNNISKTTTSSKQKMSLSAPVNIFNKKNLNRAPKSFNGIPMVPNQLRALNFNSVTGAKQILSEEELMTPDNDLLVSVNYLTLRQFETLVDFKRNSEGVKVMKSPIWNLISVETLESLSIGSLCKIEEAKSPLINYEINPKTVLPHADKYFILTDSELPSSDGYTPQEQDMASVEQYNTTNNFNIVGSTTEVITQNVTKESEIFNTEISSGQTSQTPQGITRGSRTTTTFGY